MQLVNGTELKFIDIFMGALHLDYLICNIFAVDLIRKSLKKRRKANEIL